MIEIAARINPISYEKPLIKRLIFNIIVLMVTYGQKKGAMIEIAARINPISYEKPLIKRLIFNIIMFRLKKCQKKLKIFLLKTLNPLLPPDVM